MASALVLDIALDAFSNSLSEGAIVKYPKGNRIDNEGDINLIAQILWDDVFLPLNIPEYFQFDVSNIIKLIQKHKKEIPEIEVDLIETFVGNKKEFIQKELDLCIIGSGVSKFGLSLDLTRLSEFISKNTPFISIEGLKNALENLNKTYRDRAVGYLSQALENIKGTIRYQILTLGNNVITKNNPLVQKYFTPLANGKYACNNGWIMNVNPLEDFATSNQFHYLRRTIIIWSDLVKLRFGKEKNDSSYLWKHMKEYVKKMAKVFHGFRLDNAHSTPMHVGEYFMRKARKQNNELLVISELFTGSNEMDALLAKKIGFNGLVREAHRVRF